jgi:hypothetical protein
MQKKDKDSETLVSGAEDLADRIVDIIAAPISFVAHLFANFITPGSSGAKFLGGIGFFLGTLLSSDSIWQVFFQGQPLFPWFETKWIGWGSWISLPLNPLFWIAFFISALVQIMEAKTLRGKDPVVAKEDFEEAKKYTLGQKPSTENIDLTTALWHDYKRAGMADHISGGAIALFFWIFDIFSSFSSRNPFRYTDPSTIFACLLYNLASMCAGEVGYKIWKITKRSS